MRHGGIKKWFMLQVWRLQQVAQILTLVLLALNLSLQVFGLIKWRQGSLLAISYVGVPLILLVLAMAIWTFAIFWDLRLKLWRDQMTILTEKNPYAKEKMAAKEVALYQMFWLPLLEKVANGDPKTKEAADELRMWLQKIAEDDPAVARDIKEIYEYVGKKSR